MLVLTRRVGQLLFIGPDIRVVVQEIDGLAVKLAVTAPAHIEIRRAESKDVPSVPSARHCLTYLIDTVQKVLDDEESNKGWGPDVTTVNWLREALENVRTGNVKIPEVPK